MGKLHLSKQILAAPKVLKYIESEKQAGYRLVFEGLAYL